MREAGQFSVGSDPPPQEIHHCYLFLAAPVKLYRLSGVFKDAKIFSSLAVHESWPYRDTVHDPGGLATKLHPSTKNLFLVVGQPRNTLEPPVPPRQPMAATAPVLIADKK
jgi:hypothetical protein